MNAETINFENCIVEIVRRPVKNLRIGVYPPDGRVRVTAPGRMSREAVRLAVTGRLEWIRKHQARIAGQERPAPPEYVTGETHYYMGKGYRLNIQFHDGRPKVVHRYGTIELHIPPGSSIEYREALLYGWYREQMKSQAAELIGKWEQMIGVQIAGWGVKRMKTKWGTCNIRARRIWLNLELVKRPLHCLEYIIVHELVHLLERLHNDRFKGFMDQYVPLWRQYRLELNRAPLDHGQ